MKRDRPSKPREPVPCEGASITCKEVADFLLDYTAGDLPAPARAEFERHLAACPPCIAYLDSYTKTVDLEKAALCDRGDAVPPNVPEALVRAILAAREATPAPREKKRKSDTKKTARPAPSKARRRIR